MSSFLRIIRSDRPQPDPDQDLRQEGRDGMNGLVVILVVLGGLLLEEGRAEEARFALYRVEVPDAQLDSLKLDRSEYLRVRLERMDQEYVLERAVLLEPPVFTDQDVVEYCWDQQRITLTKEGASRWQDQGGVHVPGDGLPIVILVDGEIRYAGMIWNPVSSLVSRLPQFWSLSLEHILVTGGLASRLDDQPVPDVRFDPRVKKVMQDLGKLSETCPTP